MAEVWAPSTPSEIVDDYEAKNFIVGYLVSQAGGEISFLIEEVNAAMERFHTERGLIRPALTIRVDDSTGKVFVSIEEAVAGHRRDVLYVGPERLGSTETPDNTGVGV